MKSAYWQKWNKTYRDELLMNVMPFWIKNGWDRKNGGVYTCLDRDGSLMDSTKSVWFQGRFGWIRPMPTITSGRMPNGSPRRRAAVSSWRSIASTGMDALSSR